MEGFARLQGGQIMQSCLLLEDHRDTREWFSSLLAAVFPGIRIRQADTVEKGCRLLDEERFDLAVIDLGLPDGSGLEVVERLAAESPDTFRLVATIFADEEHVFDALQRGAQGYLLKEEPRDCLERKLQAMAVGDPPLSSSIARRVLRHFHCLEAGSESSLAQAAVPANDGPLTDREVEVLHCISRGLNRGEVAQVLEISVHTVADHMKAIYRKLHVSGRAEAALEGVRRGLIDLR